MSESIHDRLPNKVLDLAFSDVHKKFYLHPFDKIVNGEDEILLLVDC